MTAFTNPGRDTPAPESDPDRGALLSDVLVRYLLGAAYRWPGMDGLLVSDALREYTALASALVVPDEMALCERHPDLASHVVAFFFLATVADGCRD